MLFVILKVQYIKTGKDNFAFKGCIKCSFISYSHLTKEWNDKIAKKVNPMHLQKVSSGFLGMETIACV